jgi:hypothetical protein
VFWAVDAVIVPAHELVDMALTFEGFEDMSTRVPGSLTLSSSAIVHRLRSALHRRKHVLVKRLCTALTSVRRKRVTPRLSERSVRVRRSRPGRFPFGGQGASRRTSCQCVRGTCL